ncbi:MAG: GMP/IMP nucleotidase [Gammaproteobacteria bacterium]|nr:GMP/IMP nucleotidase [Gammaproteobacteria bacterium]
MVNWHNISTVLLDMDGTLLDLHFDNYFWQEYLPANYAHRRGLDWLTTQRILIPKFQKLAGSLNWYCVDFWSKELNLDVETLKREVAHRICFKPTTLKFLGWLKNHGKRSVLVTNAHPKSLNIKLEHTHLDLYLDNIISAHDLGTPKENINFWSELQKTESFNPASTLLIDDNLSALKTAQQYGITHLIAILNPCSKTPHQTTNDFFGITDFDDIMP